MAPPDQAAEMPCTCGREEPVRHHHQHHDRKLSSNASFSSSLTASSSSSTTNYLPASNKLSCESIPYYAGAPDLSSFSSTASSYESFFHIEALDADDDFVADAAAAPPADNSENEFLDFQPTTTTTTLPPAVQTMLPQHKSRRQKADGGAAAAAAYDPKRLPSSMFRTRSTNPAEWSATSNESLFSIQLSSSADATAAQYADLYYDAAGFLRFPSLGRDATLPPLWLPSSASSESSSSAGGSGGLCVRHDCARCSSGGKTRKSVRFAATESVVSGDGKHSVVVTTLAIAVEETETEEAPAVAATKSPPAAGWCELGCCWGSSSPTVWWPRCCGCNEFGCHCKWWF